MNLDGESNLKPRKIMDSSITSKADLLEYNGNLKYEPPNKNLERWEGHLTVNGKEIHGSPDNLLLRGCALKNIKCCYGLVIYVGKGTKIF